MRSPTGVIAAVAVLAIGAGLATLFYRQAPPPVESTAHDEPIRHRAEDGPRFLMEVRSSPPPVSNLVEEPAEAPRRQDPMDRITGLPLFEADDALMPRIAEHYPAPDEATRPANARAIEHRVIDGDTLAALAERYLGDAGRATEVFEANRDVLSDPELLPIGAVLKIPAR